MHTTSAPSLPAAYASLYRALTDKIGTRQVSYKLTDRIAYARDQWPRSLLRYRQGELETLPDLIVWPQNAHQVSQVLVCCAEHKTPLLPVGSGSAVTGAAMPQAKGVVMDLKALSRLRRIAPNDGLIEVESGMNGLHLEERLAQENLTLGHFPSSILCSTVGGWVATRSAGQNSSYYGKIEDMVEDVEVALSDGTLRWVRGAFDLVPLIVGSEGKFGVITATRLRVHPAPTAHAYRGLLFPSLAQGTEALRALMQQSAIPPTVMRLYNPLASKISSHRKVRDAQKAPVDPEHLLFQQERLFAPTSGPQHSSWLSTQKSRVRDTLTALGHRGLRSTLQHASLTIPWLERAGGQSVMLILGTEGFEQSDIDARMDAYLALCAPFHAEDLGPYPGWHWYHTRHQVSFKQSTLFQTGAFVDTMEVAAPWSQLLPLYEEVKEAIKPHAFVMAHMSHAYVEGCSIYFTFTGYAEPEQELAVYDKIWRLGLQAAARAGGTVSHHHGIGLNKAPAMIWELGPGGLALLADLQGAFTSAPLNPGKLFVDTDLPSTSASASHAASRSSS